MRVLVLGGTVFLGRHVVDAALEAGHQVTLFHRGNHPSHRPEDVREIHGDRARDLGRLIGERFDAVVDTCAYRPSDVRASTAALGGVDHYTLVSSGSVYADLQTGVDEASEVHQPQWGDRPGPHEGGYGPLKVACEQEARLAVGDARLLVQRAGLIVGPFDVAERFTYWARRFRRHETVLVPDCRDQPLQYIDVRDLAAWTVAAFEGGIVGTMNAVGPAGQYVFGDLIDACIEVAPEAGRAEYVPEEFLLDQGVAPWTDLPVWLPTRLGMSGLLQLDGGRALAAGLAPRPLGDTVRDSVADPADVATDIDFGTRAAGTGMSPQREVELLDAWDQHSAGQA